MPNMETSFSPQIYAENADHKTIGAGVAGAHQQSAMNIGRQAPGYQRLKRLFSPQIYAENADHKTIGADVACG